MYCGRSKQFLSSPFTTNIGANASWGNIQGYIGDQQDLISALSSKQDTLISGTNIKTIDNQSILGSGNLTVTPQIDEKTILNGQDGLKTAVGGYEWDETVRTGNPVTITLPLTMTMTTHNSTQDSDNAGTILPHTTMGGMWWNIQQFFNPNGTKPGGSSTPIPSADRTHIKSTLVINGQTIWTDLEPSIYGSMNSKYCKKSIIPNEEGSQEALNNTNATWCRWVYGSGRLTLNAGEYNSGYTGTAANPQYKDYWYFTYYDVNTGTKKTWTTSDTATLTITITCEDDTKFYSRPLEKIDGSELRYVTDRPPYYYAYEENTDLALDLINDFDRAVAVNPDVTDEVSNKVYGLLFEPDNDYFVCGGTYSHEAGTNRFSAGSDSLEGDYSTVGDHDTDHSNIYLNNSQDLLNSGSYAIFYHELTVTPQYSEEIVHHVETIDPKFILPLEKEYEETDSETGDVYNDKVSLNEFEFKFEHSEEVESVEDKSEATLTASSLMFSKDGFMGISINYDNIQIPDPNGIKPTLTLDYDTVEALLALLNQ